MDGAPQASSPTFRVRLIVVQVRGEFDSTLEVSGYGNWAHTKRCCCVLFGWMHELRSSLATVVRVGPDISQYSKTASLTRTMDSLGENIRDGTRSEDALRPPHFSGLAQSLIRRVFDYHTRHVDFDAPAPPLPRCLEAVTRKMGERNLKPYDPDQMTLNEYNP